MSQTRVSEGARDWVLLHGFTGNPSAWDTVAQALEPHGRVIRPALTGHGPGTGLGSGFVAEVDRIASLIEASGLRRAHLCGYSLGARVALGLLVRHARLFGGATLIGGNPGLDEGSPERDVRAASDERWAQLAQRSVVEFLEQWRAQPIFATQAALEPQRRDAQDRLRASHDGAGLAAAMRALSLAGMPDWRPFLGAIPFPVHLMVGALDTKFVELSHRMAPLLSQGRLTVVPDVGHNVLLERPDAVIGALLARPDAGSGARLVPAA